MTRGTKIPILVAVATSLIATTPPTAGQASEGRRTPDEARTLISTDVGDERWAITWNDTEDGTITGNVFFADGGEPAFLWCEDMTAEDETESVSVSCFGADACTASPCLLSDWSHVQDVTVPTSFFDAPNLEWLSIGDPVPLPISFLNPPEEGDDSERGSGVQITVDDARVLINKDVGRERWAITRNVEDGSLTGNIFTTEGADPDFIWCDEESYDTDSGEASYSCYVPGTNPPQPTPTPSPTPTPTPTPTPRPTVDPFKPARYDAPFGCDQYRESYPTVFAHVVPGPNFGTCWQCPRGFDRSVLPITGNSACLKGGFIGIGADYEPAFQVGEWGCGSGSFREGLTDRCWTCPSQYEYDDSKDPDDPRACYFAPR